MGNIWMDQTYVDELTRWGVPSSFADGWLTRSRSSGGYDELLGIIIHHAADAGPNTTLTGTEGWAIRTSPNRPIGSGTGTRTKQGPKWHGWAAGATNTAGKGGPILNSAGQTIPLDAGNRYTVNTEWMHNGSTEVWTEDVCDLYVRWTCATLTWANRVRAKRGQKPLGAGDVWSHFEWAPTRKNDPFGPCRWNRHTTSKWNMHSFRAEVLCHLIDGPGPLRRFDPATGSVPPKVIVAPAPTPEVPNPPAPPATGGEGATLLPNGWYRVRDRQWAAAIAGLVLGDADRWPEIAAINRPRDQWHAGSFVAIPGVPSVVVTVKSGEGLHAVIKRALPGEDPRAREAATWEWNGGVHTLKPGEVISVPVFWPEPS